MRVLVARLRNETQREDEGDDTDGHVDEEDPWPGEVLRQEAAENEADGRTADCDRRPNPERACAFPTFRERGRDDRERGGRDERGAEALQRTGTDQHPLA